MAAVRGLRPGRLSPARPRFLVLAMWKPLYLAWGERLARALEEGYRARATVERAFADSFSRAEVVERLASGPALVVYVGHGRARGWSGYRALRWRHVEGVAAFRSAGVVFSLACDTLRDGADGAPSFGRRWVESGRADAFVGAGAPVGIEAMIEVAKALCEELRGGEHVRLGDLLDAVDRRVAASGDSGAAEAWRRFGVIGRRDQPFASARQCRCAAACSTSPRRGTASRRSSR